MKMKIIYLFNEIKTELKKVQWKKLLVIGVLIGVIMGTFGHCVSIGVFAVDSQSSSNIMILKAGTYTFNRELDFSMLEYEQPNLSYEEYFCNINIPFTISANGITLPFIAIRVIMGRESSDSEWLYIMEYVLDDSVDNNQIVYSTTQLNDLLLGWQFDEFRNFIITEDIYVSGSSRDWFISNTNYNDVNGGSGGSDALLGQTRYFSTSLDFSAVSGVVHDQFIYISNGSRYSGMMIGSSLQTVSYMSTAGSVAVYSNANNPKWLNSNMRYITFVTLPQDPAVLQFILDNSVSRGYGDIGEDTYDQGYDDGYNVGLVAGRIEGYNEGLDVGKEQGLNEGQEIGYNKGYQQGLLDGGNNPSKELVQSFIGDLFSLPQRLLDSIVFYQETLDDGGTPEDFSDDVILRITPWTAFVVVFIVSLIIILLKVWRGG